MGDPHHQPGVLLEFQDFLEVPVPDPGTSLLKAEEFPARKSKPSQGKSIPGQEEFDQGHPMIPGL